MKVLHINNTASVPYNLCLGLRKIGYEADLFCKSQPSNKNEDWIKIPECKYDWYSQDEINYSDYDIIHIHHPISLATSISRMKALINRNKVVIHFHGSLTSNIRNLDYKQKIADKISTYKPDAVIYATPNILQNIISRFDVPKFLPNPVIVPEIPEIDKLFKYDNRILIFSEMYKFKQIDEWIDLIKSFPEIKFDIINRGQDILYFKKIFPENVNYIGPVSHNDIYRLLAKYPLVLGQRNGLISVSELESMACGINTIFKWNYDNYYDNSLPNQYPLLHNKLKELMTNNELGLKQKEWIKENHDHINVAKQLSKIYVDLW